MGNGLFNWADLVFIGLIIMFVVSVVAYALSTNKRINPITQEHDKFNECIALEYPRDFCLALVDDD